MKSKCVLNMINEINTITNNYIGQEVKALNLPIRIGHIPLFFILPDDGGSMEFRELREQWNISKSSLSDLLHKYEAIGYIEKSTTCDDKRCVMIGLTKQALEVKSQFIAIEAKILNTMLNGFEVTEREKLEKDIVTILSNMKTL